MPSRSRKRLSGWRRYAAGGALAAALVAADQLTKALILKHLWPGRLVEVIPGVLNFTLSQNTGGVFGMLSDKRLLFTILSIVAIGLLCYLFTRLAGKPGASFAAASIFAGAVGNLADRFRHGYVVDFIDLHAGAWHWYVFNVADAAITIGALSLFVLTFLDERRGQREKREEKPPAASTP